MSIDAFQIKPSITKVITKVSKKTVVNLPIAPASHEYELFKKDIITKNKRYFLFYEDKCMFFQVLNFF